MGKSEVAGSPDLVSSKALLGGRVQGGTHFFLLPEQHKDTVM